MSKVLVTGAAGFIGSHLVDSLLLRGYEVVAIDNESAESNDRFYWSNWDEPDRLGPRVYNHKLDVTDFKQIEGLFQYVDCVYHLAAEARIQPSFDNPLLTVGTNVLGTAAVLAAAEKHGVRRVVFASTSSTYDTGKDYLRRPIRESDPTGSKTPYGASKLGGESLCEAYAASSKVDTTILRYFNVYGARQPSRGHYAPVVGKFLRQWINNEPLTVVGDGWQKRDFTCVHDIVAGTILAGEYPRRLNGEVFNLGSGRYYSINEIADWVVSGSEVPIQHVPLRKSEARMTWADITKACAMLKYEPRGDLHNWIVKEKSRMACDAIEVAAAKEFAGEF